jgi:hypothetical protein
MIEKVPSPFNSPFMKVLLAILWLAYFVMLIYLIVARGGPLIILVGGWSLLLPWITWNFLSGVRVERGRSVGGGPMHPRVALEPDEGVLFNGPVYANAGSDGVHLFVTDRRMIVLPIRFFGVVRTVRLSDVVAVRSQSKGRGWALPKESVDVTFSGGSLELRPWVGPRWMGLMAAGDFIIGLTAALKSAGVPRDA